MDSAVLKFVKPSDVSEELEKTKTYAEKIARISVAEVYPLTKKAVSLSAAFLIDPCVDGFPTRFSNVGLLNQLEGLVDVDIDSDGGDPNYALHVRIGIEQYAGIRSDYSFGRESVRLGGAQIPTHHMIHVKGKPSDYSNYLPGKIIVDGNKCNTELRFTSPKRGAVDPTKHTVAPGSILPRKDSSPESPSYELSKWVSFKGTTTPTIYETPDLIRGVAAGNVIHLMVPHWNANYRHELCKPFTGFLARHAKEAEAINTDPSHPLHRQVITTLRDRSDAERLLELICKAVGDDELKDRLRLLNGALDDCDAGRKVLGRPALSSFVNDSALVLQLEFDADPRRAPEFGERAAGRSGPGQNQRRSALLREKRSHQGRTVRLFPAPPVQRLQGQDRPVREEVHQHIRTIRAVGREVESHRRRELYSRTNRPVNCCRSSTASSFQTTTTVTPPAR